VAAVLLAAKLAATRQMEPDTQIHG
jgi:hypothetical protein